MPSSASLLPFYQGWETYQRMLVEVIEPLTPEQLALPLGHTGRTIEHLIRHIIEARIVWFGLWMGQGETDLAPWGDGGQPILDAARLIAALKRTWRTIEDALAGWTPATLDDALPTPPGEHFTPRTRRWILWHTFEHEIHHGGELSLALGAHGIPGIYGDM